MAKYPFALIFLLASIQGNTQGTSCSDAINLTVDGSLNVFSTSSTTGSNVLCTSYGTTPITWFRFTTNASAECPLLNITASDGQAMEVAMYTGCGGNMNNNLESPSSMCFYDGTGLWAPAQSYVLSANTNYYLRVKTSTSCNVSIGAQLYTPSNDDCLGATPINGTPVSDNNSCHQAGPGVLPGDLCAASLENTAFYQFYVANNGSCIININNISCDNGNNSSNGFQIGFFTGNCSSLTAISPCTTGSGAGGFVQATTTGLDAGTKVYVAVDGNYGSNCRYDISATNAIILSAAIKSFSCWKTSNSNVLRWTSADHGILHFEIEKSDDGYNFYSIGRVSSIHDQRGSNYSFDDTRLTMKAWYRIKTVSGKRENEFSKVVLVSRPEMSNKISVMIKDNVLNLKFSAESAGKNELVIIDAIGRPIIQTTIDSHKGENLYIKKMPFSSKGNYVVLLNSKEGRQTKSFISVD